MKLEDLLRIVSEDDDGLLDVKPASTGVFSADERLVNLFKEIETFYLENGREPGGDTGNVPEFKLFSRLSGFRESAEKSELLRPFDEYGLLGKPVETIQDIFTDDSMGLLDTGPDDIFTFRHVPKDVDLPDRIAKRKPCPDFKEFEPLFAQCHAELKDGTREARAFTGEQQIREGHFFIVHGVMVYVAHVGEPERIAKNGKLNARLRCIYENGTESDILLRSLARELYRDEAGRRILDSRDKALEELEGIQAEDKEAGHIYVLSSRSTLPAVTAIPNLFKIGFTKGSVQDRIKNAEHEPTYLMAPVKVEAAYRAYNMNVHKFETLLHTFFGENCLDITVTDDAGKKAVPREWFVAPLHIIEAAVQLLQNGEIVHYRYDGLTEDIVLR
ncbi:GIY-YIG nuclease family protein [Paraburkholderia sp. D15]|uniref:GIY-YIG nuclease family protein n=1 Tax=Paraburkholderia sp. D15 TaxID=2880218 RepID=UPI002479C421|nr:GIY-YIG nuclease family protein [Paraburkholderia sp. D15]WGS54405.1 GIY-YIG nuclease family protein [Paraburkholderia sp. D15]